MICHVIFTYPPLDKPISPDPPPSTGQVRRRVDLDLKAHDAFLVGREKNCDVVLEGLEMLGGRFPDAESGKGKKRWVK